MQAMGLGLRTNTRVHIHDRAYFFMGRSGQFRSYSGPRLNSQEAFQVGTIHSKHGLILNCTIECPDADEEVQRLLGNVGSSLQDKRYAFITEGDRREAGLVVDNVDVHREVWDWLRKEMSI